MLSEFLRFGLVDRSMQRGRLRDLAVDLAAGDYPPVLLLLVRGTIETAADAAQALTPVAGSAAGGLFGLLGAFLLLLINDPRLAGDLKNGRLANVLGWGTFGLVTMAVATLLGTQLLGLFGVTIFGEA